MLNTNDRARRDGRHSDQWRKRIRPAVIARDGACLHCGATTHLTVHRLGGGYHDANIDHYMTLCRRCHGRVDGGMGGWRRHAETPADRKSVV